MNYISVFTMCKRAADGKADAETYPSGLMEATKRAARRAAEQQEAAEQQKRLNRDRDFMYTNSGFDEIGKGYEMYTDPNNPVNESNFYTDIAGINNYNKYYGGWQGKPVSFDKWLAKQPESTQNAYNTRMSPEFIQRQKEYFDKKKKRGGNVVNSNPTRNSRGLNFFMDRGNTGAKTVSAEDVEK